ncbi:XRE family transcriptional regulator [Actinomadura sp. GC306]|uniref:helix-turn-helix domain-containing protein n=1 Tax=Actinomadura sp. GC306 TaxID=2530367 RepID=UPI00104FFDB2|nr:helix-turn-helix transcriptional regulator [Actinomadura sp. GC306]TDC69461.1 XRE family transcriptional regulator [Actinomadura sp. GC306]
MAEIVRPLPSADETPHPPREPHRPHQPHQPHEPRRPGGPGQEPLWREALGECLRRLRTERGEILAETARRAGVSPQYLSEMERGVKEPSSEMIAAVAGALGVTLADLTLAVTTTLVGAPVSAPAGPTAYALAA